MEKISPFERLYRYVRQNRWLWYFTWFNRFALAAGFVAAGFVKISGERFASGLSSNHPMGHYLEALFHTGYYYPFIGVIQVFAGVLLLIPRTATLGALLYFPIILNITVLSFAVRFEGSLFSAPLMLLSNIYLLCWDWEKLKPILSYPSHTNYTFLKKEKKLSNRFPFLFFGACLAFIIVGGFTIVYSFHIMPRNNLANCKKQFTNTRRSEAGCNFCDCIHKDGKPLEDCLKAYQKAPDNFNRKSAAVSATK